MCVCQPEICFSRNHEVLNEKHDSGVKIDAAGNNEVRKAIDQTPAPAGTELKLRAAWQPRALALDIAPVVSFPVNERWRNYLFQRVLRDEPNGFRPVGLGQALSADKQMRVLLAERTRGWLPRLYGQGRPRWTWHAEERKGREGCSTKTAHNHPTCSFFNGPCFPEAQDPSWKEMPKRIETMLEDWLK